MKALSYAGIGALTLAMFTPAVSLAEVESASSSTNGSHSLVHRVSHSLAGASTYTSNGNAGYKWNKDVQPSESHTNQWAETSSTRSGYKWGNSIPTRIRNLRWRVFLQVGDYEFF